MSQQYNTFLHQLTFLAKTGVGNSDAPNPTMTLNISRDGGETYGNDITLELGVAGDYTKRLEVRRLGKYRNGVAVVTIEDPVFVGLLACFADIDDGVS